MPKSLWDTYSSLANTYGGCIICGVAERNDAGLDEPVVDELFGGGNPDRTILTLPLAKNLGTNLGTTEVESEKRSQLLEFCSEPRSKSEIQEQLGIKSERYVRQILINSLLESGELIRTIPDKPNSPKQRYVRKK